MFQQLKSCLKKHFLRKLDSEAFFFELLFIPHITAQPGYDVFIPGCMM